MPRSIIAILLAGSLVMGACSPAFDWREVRFPPTPLTAMFPCKPVRETRPVRMAGHLVDLAMASCQTAGITVAVGFMQSPVGIGADDALAQWQQATLASMGARDVRVPTNPYDRPDWRRQARAVRAHGRTADGAAVELHGLWFKHGTAAYAALVFGARPPEDVVETFQGGLRLP